MAARDYRVFAAAALRRPFVIGAVAPSTPALGRLLAVVVPIEGTPLVVELGPGTGAVSSVIRARLPAGGRHLAVELDAGMVEHLRRTRPWLEVLHGDAVDLSALLGCAEVYGADAVISGLPWSLIGDEVQRRVIAQVRQVLRPSGVFTTFGYLHALPLGSARRFRALLDQHFDEVETTRAVWRNLPPALVYRCSGPVG